MGNETVTWYCVPEEIDQAMTCPGNKTAGWYGYTPSRSEDIGNQFMRIRRMRFTCVAD